MRTGSVRQLNEGLQAHQGAFIRAGTYLLMEKLRQAVCRRLLKRVWLLHREADPDKAHQLPLGARRPPARSARGLLRCGSRESIERVPQRGLYDAASLQAHGA
jgi:hypothetical protein